MGTRGARPVVAKLELCPECMARISESLITSVLKAGLKACDGGCDRFFPPDCLYKYGDYGYFCEDCSARLSDE
jgi:hypothetical protein